MQQVACDYCDATVESKAEARRSGWKRFPDTWACPDCVKEQPWKDENRDAY